jgi:hypothetical protein
LQARHKEEIMFRILVSTVALVLGAALASPAAAQSGVDLALGARAVVRADGGVEIPR